MAAQKLVKKCSLEEVSYEKDDLFLRVSYIFNNKTYLNQPVSLMCIERQTEKVHSFPVNFVGIEGEKSILSSIIYKNELQYLLKNGEYWDFYINFLFEEPLEENDIDRENEFINEFDDENDVEDHNENDFLEDESENKINKDFRKYRLKCQDSYVDLFFYLNNIEEKMLIPYSTNKGNFSFKVRDIIPIAKVDYCTLSKKGLLTIKGFAVHPKFDSIKSMVSRKIVIKDADDKLIIKRDVEIEERPDLQTKYGHHKFDFRLSGFSLNENILSILEQIVDEKIKLKMYLEYSLEKNGENITIQSLPIKLIDESSNATPNKMIFKTAKIKKKVKITSTKKAKSLLISVNNYYLRKEIKTKIRRLIFKIKKHPIIKKTYKGVFGLIGKLPAKKNLVIFESYLGKQYSCNPRAIYEYLKENNPEYKMFWSVDKRFIQNFDNKDIEYIYRFSIKWLFVMARAKYWVTNSRLPLWIPKPKHTIYLQTWHGTPLKKLAADMDEVHMPGTTTSKYKKNFIRESRNWDYLISPNRYSTEIFKRAFVFEKEMVESGYPRNDYLYKCNKPDNIENLKLKFGIPLNKKVILYAPTWRDNQFYAKGKYKFDLELDLNLMKENLGDDYVIILRMHYLVAENLDLTLYKDFAYDFSNHEDINELYIISDLLITDYSSVFFDYGNLKRPMLFFVYDIESYRDNLRGFYFDFEKYAPGPLIKTTTEVIENIKTLENEGYPLSPSFKNFYDKFCYLEDGNSSKRVVEKVFYK